MNCSIEGCPDDAKAKGWCGKHYQRWKAHGHPYRILHKKWEDCRSGGCKRKAKARGFCEKHYANQYNDGRIKPISKPPNVARGETNHARFAARATLPPDIKEAYE